MILDQHTAERLARLMKIRLPGERFEGTQRISLITYAPEGSSTLEIEWYSELRDPPTDISIRRRRPDAHVTPELYARWVGFTQAYGIKAGWGD